MAAFPTLGRRAGTAIAAYAFFVTMLGTTLPTPLYGLYRAELGFSQLMVTVIFAMYAVGVIAALLLFGRLSDQLGRRALLAPGLLLSALSAVAFLLAHGLVALLAGRLLSGLSAGIFTGTATATIVDLAAPGQQGRATLLATMTNLGGLGCGPLLAGALAQWAGSPLHVPFWVDLALLVPAFAGLGVLPDPITRDRSVPVRIRPQALHVPAAMRAVFLRASLAAFAGFAVLGLCTAVFPAFLTQVLGVTSHLAVGAVVFAVFVASIAGQLALERVPAPVALPAGCTALIAGMALLALALVTGSLGLLIAGGLIAGAGQGLSFRAGLAALNHAAPDANRGEVASSFFVVAYVAISLPVVGVGVLADASSLKTAGELFAAVVAAVAAVVLVLLARDGATPSRP